MPDPSSARHLYLCGYRAVGKSTVAGLIADRLDRPVIDLDVEIATEASRCIAEIFADEGEAGFRDRESRRLMSLPASPPAVISLGGGTVVRSENRQWIIRTGVTLWLTAEVDTIVGRLTGDAATAASRPSLTAAGVHDEVRTVLQQRQQWYEAVATLRVATDGLTAAEVAERGLAAWRTLSLTEPAFPPVARRR